MTTRKTLSLLLGIAALFALALIIRLYALDTIPGEIYGDIILVHDWFESVRSGIGLPAFFLSVGPLYFYLFAFVIDLFGDSYFVLKAISVGVGVATIPLFFFLVREITDDTWAAVWAVAFLSVSKWHIIHSRLGDHRIIVPFLAVLAALLLVRFFRSKKLVLLIGSAVLAGLCLYTYIPAWAIPVTIGMQFVLLSGWRRKTFYYAAVFVLCVGVIALPLVSAMRSDQANFFGGGYIGSKLFQSPLSTGDKIGRFVTNMGKSFGMFHLRGDVVFRNNPPNEPHMDVISGIVLLLGVVICLRNYRLSVLLLLPVAMLIIPNSLVVNFPNEVPNSARTLAVVPFAFALAGVGAGTALRRLHAGIRTKIVVPAVAGSVFALVSFLNLHSYFVTYANNLPNHNTAFGRIIADDVRALSYPQTTVVSCCWGEWGQPEPKGILYALPASTRTALSFQSEFSCSEAQTASRIIFPPDKEPVTRSIEACFKTASQVRMQNGQKVYRYVLGRGQGE